MDEKSQLQALDRNPPLPMKPHQAERRTHGYGTATLIAALDVATGEVSGAWYPKHREIGFLPS